MSWVRIPSLTPLKVALTRGFRHDLEKPDLRKAKWGAERANPAVRQAAIEIAQERFAGQHAAPGAGSAVGWRADGLRYGQAGGAVG